MKCPKCGTPMRPSKKYPGYYLCDKCRKRYPGSSNKTSNKVSRKVRKKKKSKLPLLLLLVILLATGVFLLFKSGILSGEDTSGKALEPQTSTFSSDETASLNGADLKILSKETSNGNNQIKPSNGNVFLLLEIEVTNASDSKISIRDTANFKASYHGEVIEHSASAYATLSDKKDRLTGTIEANETLVGYVCYEVPEDFDVVEIEFSNPVWYNQKIAFTIEK